MSYVPDLYDSLLALDEAGRLDFIVDACGIGLWLNPLPLGALNWNQHTKAHFHLPPEARVDMDLFWRRVHPDDRERVRDEIAAALELRQLFDTVYRTVGPNGALKWIRAVGCTVGDDAGKPLHFDGITLDLTEQMSAQHLLRQNEAEMRGFANAAPAMLWATEPDGYCSFLSQGWYSFTGQKEEEALGFGWLAAVHPDDRAEAQRRFLQCTDGRQRYLVEHRVRRTGGDWRWVLCDGQPRFAPGGAFLGFVGSVTDIHQHKLAEQRLRESEERYRSFVANSTEGIWRMEFDPPVDMALPVDAQIAQLYANGRFAECNDAFARMYGFGHAGELVGQDLGSMLPRGEPASHAYLGALAAQGFRVSEIESQERDREGRTVHFANSLSGVIEDGRLVRAWGTQRDISDRKRIEAALVDADRRKDDFLATLAHELRNPLAPIRNAVELLRRRGAIDTALASQRDMIDRQVSHLTRLIDDLLDVSRITRDKLDLRKAPLELGELLRSAADNMRGELETGRHALHLSLPGEPLVVEGDAVRLQQVVSNLLSNASKYSPAGGPIWLEAAEDEGQAVLRVRDAGMGIAAEHLPRVFDMFYQADRGLNRSHGGLGIGLSLVQRLVQLHGGSVRVSSKGPGMGSEFEVRLPLAAAQHRDAREIDAASGDTATVERPDSTDMQAAQDLEAATALHVLVVDDNHDAADTLAEVLEIMGCRTDTAYDGLEGVEKAEKLRPAAIVLDLGMPRLNGYEACERIRARPWGKSIRVVAVSGWGQQDDRRRSTEAGFDAHLVKPVAPDELMALLVPPQG